MSKESPKQFAAGQKLVAQNWTDSENPYYGECVRRISDKTIIFRRCEGADEVRAKIHRYDDGREYCCPMGRYSLAPCFSPA